jgi:hypothetical protein
MTKVESDKKLERIEAAILGNGHEGLMVRTARIEEKVTSIADKADEASKNAILAADKAQVAGDKAEELVSRLAIEVTEIGDALKSHLGTDHLSSLMRQKGFWVLIVLGFISLHLIATYVPNMWDFAMGLLGIPKLIIPIA